MNRSAHVDMNIITMIPVFSPRLTVSVYRLRHVENDHPFKDEKLFYVFYDDVEKAPQVHSTDTIATKTHGSLSWHTAYTLV